MGNRIFEFVSRWRCKKCGASGNVEYESVPSKCSKCGSTKISADPIKKDGPYGDGSEKRY